MKNLVTVTLLLLLTAPIAVAQSVMTFPTGGGGTGIVIPNYTANGGLPHWKACLASFKAGTSSACNNSTGPVIVVIGDSQNTGHGSLYSGTANDARSGSWPNQLAAIFNLPGNSISSHTNNVFGTNSITPTSTYDTRVTTHGWGAFAGLFVAGGALWANTDATSFIFNPTDYASYPSAPPIQTNAIDIYWAGNTGDANTVVSATQNSGTSGVATTTSTTLTFASAPSVNPTTGASAFIYGPGITVGTTVSAYNSGSLTMTLSAAASVPAASTLSFNPSTICTITGNVGSFVFRKTTCTTPLGPNVYSFVCSSATANLCSPETLNAYNSSVQQVSVLQGASDGSIVANWAQNNSFPTDPNASMSVYLPDLIIFGEIANDAAAQTSIASYSTSLTTIVTASKSAVSGVSGKSTDVLLNTGLPYAGGSSPITIAQYQTAVATVAGTQNVPVWDSMTTYGGTPNGWNAGVPRGWVGSCCGATDDTDHWSIMGYGYEAMIYSQILQQ